MIVYIASDSTLQIPKGLGNFAADSVDIEPLSGSVVELSATTVTLSGAVETLNKSVGSQGDAIAGLLLDVDGLDTRVSGNTEDIAALSAQTTANTAHIEALSASTVAISNEVKEDIYVYLKDLNAMTTEEKTAAWVALEEKYLAGHSIYLVAGSDNPTTNLILPLAKYQPHKEGEQLTGYFDFSVIEGGGNAFYDVTLWQRGVIFGNTGPRATKKVMYTLPKASSSKLGGIKVGSGLTMSGDFLNLEIGEGLGFSGNTLVVSGGSENGGNYLIVNSLSDISNPYEGLEAYVKERTEHLQYTGYTIDASQISEGYAAHIYYDGTNETPVYRSGEGFYWEWDNGTTEKFIDKGDYYYKINSNHTVFTVLLKNPAAYVTFEGGVTTATTSDTIEIFHKSVTYRYNGTEWEEYQAPKVYYLDEMTQSERVDLYNDIFRYKEKTFPAGNYRFFVTNEGNDEYQGRFEVFVARFYGGDGVSFSGLIQSRYNKVLLQRGYKLTSTGDFNPEFSENADLSKLSDIYDAFIVAQYDNGNKSLTGITHSTKATMWESYKAEGNEGYARKTIVAYVHTGDVVPARFNLISVDGNMGENESGVKLYFGAVYNSIADSSLHSVRFSLSKNVETDVYTIGDIVEYSYTATV